MQLITKIEDQGSLVADMIFDQYLVKSYGFNAFYNGDKFLEEELLKIFILEYGIHCGDDDGFVNDLIGSDNKCQL